MTDDELYKLCKEVWKSKTSWGLSIDEFRSLTFSSKDGDGKERLKGDTTRLPGDIVYVSPTGGKMTRHMCDNWLADFGPFHHGFVTAWRMLEQALDDAALNAAGPNA